MNLINTLNQSVAIEIKQYQIIKIVSVPEKYNRDTILIDKDIFYKQFKTSFMLTCNLKNGDSDPFSFYIKNILDRLTIKPEEFLDRLKFVKNIILTSGYHKI
jgi:aminoglycoside/choline kinase family phosphotransferase